MNLNEDLIDAAENGNLDEVRKALEKGADVNAKDKYSNTALMKAAVKGHSDIVELLIEEGADTDAKDVFDETALFNAVLKGHFHIVKLLIENGADVNVKDALTEAIKGGYPHIVGLLIGYGADVNGKDLYEAACKDYSDIIKLLIEIGDFNVDEINNALAGACSQRVINILIEEGGDLNAKDDYGYTPLMWAIDNDYPGKVKLFIDAGADVNVVCDGHTPLEMARGMGREEIVSILEEAGAEDY